MLKVKADLTTVRNIILVVSLQGHKVNLSVCCFLHQFLVECLSGNWFVNLKVPFYFHAFIEDKCIHVNMDRDLAGSHVNLVMPHKVVTVV